VPLGPETEIRRPNRAAESGQGRQIEIETFSVWDCPWLSVTVIVVDRPPEFDVVTLVTVNEFDDCAGETVAIAVLLLTALNLPV
jgi:hypothetical protein